MTKRFVTYLGGLVFLICTATWCTDQSGLREQASNAATASQTTTREEGQSLPDGPEIPVRTAGTKHTQTIRHKGYTLSFDPRHNTPEWVAWELTSQEANGTKPRADEFLPDPNVDEAHRVTTEDYKGSGYDRGHMIPAADMKWDSRAMAESFYMSNICPQDQKLNRDDWGDLEDLCRAWAKKYGRVYITCGPIYDSKRPKRIGKHRVAVPNRFFKVVLIYNRKNPVAMGFLFDNKAHHQDLRHYMVPVDSIESITGYDFFAKVPDDVEQRIEAVVPALPAR